MSWVNGENTSPCTLTSGARPRTARSVRSCQGGKKSSFEAGSAAKPHVHGQVTPETSCGSM